MPAPKRIQRENILEAALQVFRKKGFDAVNARSIALELKCSTQPIYIEFQNMQELKEEIVEAVLDSHKKRVETNLSREDGNAYRAYGLGFVQFARDEREFFRFLYLSADEGGKLRDDIYREAILETMQREYGYTLEIAEKFHFDMHNYTYGIAMMENTGYCHFSDAEIEEMLHRQFLALTGIYGIPPLFLQKKKQYKDAPTLSK